MLVFWLNYNSIQTVVRSVNMQTYIKKVPQFERLGLNINVELKYINSQNLPWLSLCGDHRA